MLKEVAKIDKVITARGNKSPPEVIYESGDEFFIRGQFVIESWIGQHSIRCRLTAAHTPVLCEFFLPASLSVFGLDYAYVHPCDLPHIHVDYLIWKEQSEDIVFRPSDGITYKLMLDPKFKDTGKYWLLNIPEAGHPSPRKSKIMEPSDIENILSKLMYKTFDGTAVRGQILYFTMQGRQESLATQTSKSRFYVTDKMKKKVVENESTRFEIRFFVEIEGIQFFLNNSVIQVEGK